MGLEIHRLRQERQWERARQLVTPYRDGARCALPRSPWERRADAGKAWACREMHEPVTVAAASTRRDFGEICVFLFPRKVSFLCQRI